MVALGYIQSPLPQTFPKPQKRTSECTLPAESPHNPHVEGRSSMTWAISPELLFGAFSLVLGFPEVALFFLFLGGGGGGVCDCGDLGGEVHIYPIFFLLKGGLEGESYASQKAMTSWQTLETFGLNHQLKEALPRSSSMSSTIFITSSTLWAGKVTRMATEMSMLVCKGMCTAYEL